MTDGALEKEVVDKQEVRGLNACTGVSLLSEFVHFQSLGIKNS